MTSTSNLNSDTSGDGVLNYGTSQNLNLQSSTNNRLWEMQVDFEDLSNNPVDADWQVLGFSGTATSGTAYLPISEADQKLLQHLQVLGQYLIQSVFKVVLTPCKFR